MASLVPWIKSFFMAFYLDQIVEKGRPAPGFHHGDGPGNAVQEIMIPASKAGLVIGKGGETIKQLQVLLFKMITLSILKPVSSFSPFVNTSDFCD